MSDPLMGIRQFLRGGVRELTEPTTIISGTTRLGVWIPESWKGEASIGPGTVDAASRPAHPETEGALTAPPIGGAVQDTGDGAMPNPPAGERTEAPSHGGAAPRTVSEPSTAGTGHRASGTSPVVPARRKSIQATLDAAAKEGRQK